MKDHCDKHPFYKSGCPDCWPLRKAFADSIRKRESDLVKDVHCPVCNGPCLLLDRTEYDLSEGGGSERYIYLQCQVCGTRSKEVIGDRNRQVHLLNQWSQPAMSMTLEELKAAPCTCKIRIDCPCGDEMCEHNLKITCFRCQRIEEMEKENK